MNTKAIHMSSEPNEKLYAKFEAEMEEYKAELLAMPHDEILENAYEYATRQDILLVLQTHDLTDKQCNQLSAEILNPFIHTKKRSVSSATRKENSKDRHLTEPSITRTERWSKLLPEQLSYAIAEVRISEV